MIQICNLLSFCFLRGMFVCMLVLDEKDYVSVVLSKFKYAIIWPVMTHRIKVSLVA